MIVNHVDPVRLAQAEEIAKVAGMPAAPEPITIGDVRYTSTARLHRGKDEERVAVTIFPSDFLGRRTAELHLALASDKYDEAFAPEPFTAVDRRSLHHGAKSLLRRSLRTVRSVREPSECVRELLARESDLFDPAQAAQPVPGGPQPP